MLRYEVAIYIIYNSIQQAAYGFCGEVRIWGMKDPARNERFDPACLSAGCYRIKR